MKKTVFLTIVFTLVASTYIDYSMSYNAIQTGHYAESNPFTKSIVSRPALALPIITITGGGLCYGLEHLYKDNKTAAWVIVGMLTIVKGYVIWHNVKVLRWTK